MNEKNEEFVRPTEWDNALNSLYNLYGYNQTVTQKLTILIHVLGDCCVSYMGMYMIPSHYSLEFI